MGTWRPRTNDSCSRMRNWNGRAGILSRRRTGGVEMKRFLNFLTTFYPKKHEKTRNRFGTFQELISVSERRHQRLLAAWRSLNELRPFLVDTRNSVARTFAQMATRIHEVNLKSQAALHKMALRLSYERALDEVSFPYLLTNLLTYLISFLLTHLLTYLLIYLRTY